MKYFNYFRVILSFIILFFLFYKIYQERQQIIDLGKKLDGKSLFFVSFIALLMLPNQFIEVLKWKRTNNRLNVPQNWNESILAVFTGNSSAFITPNRVGEYFGRLMFVSEENRLKAFWITFIDRLQLMNVTLFMGSIASFYFSTSLIFSITILSLSTIFLIIFESPKLFSISLNLFSPLISYFRLIETYLVESKDILNNLKVFWLVENQLLSFSRYLIYTLQYLLMMRIFGLEYPFLDTILMIFWIYLIKSILPSIAFSELGTREAVAVWVFEQQNLPVSIAISATFAIYIINILIPALIGWFLLQKSLL